MSYLYRLNALFSVLYLLFNEGYKSSDSNKYIRVELCAESIRLGERLIGHTGDQGPTLHALLALIYFQSSRLPARLTDGETINLLKDQNLSLWDKRLLAKGFEHFKSATKGNKFSRYYLEASIAGYHCAASSFNETDWKSILRLYDTLFKYYQTPIIQLNRAIAQGYTLGPQKAIKTLNAIETDPIHFTSQLIFHLISNALRHHYENCYSARPS